MNKVVLFSAVPKTLEQRHVHARIEDVHDALRRAGLYDERFIPHVRYVSEKDSTSSSFAHKVWYARDQRTVYIDLKLLAGFGMMTREQLVDNPGMAKAFAPGGEQLLRKTTDVELAGLLASSFAEHLIQSFAETELTESWMQNLTSKEVHEEFSARLVYCGIVEWCAELVCPKSEYVSDTLWEQYNEDAALKADTYARSWIESRGGALLVDAILRRHAMRGLRYLLTVPLHVDRHFSLKNVLTYRDTALTALAETAST